MNTICCLKVGEKYSSDYVNNLYCMIKKNVSSKTNLFCFTDNEKDIIKSVNIIKIPYIKNIQGWFYKLSLFDEKINPLEGTLLFLDLDIIIVNKIDCFFEYEKEKNFVIIEDWLYKNNNIKKYNSSVFRWNTKHYKNIFTDYLNKENVKKYAGDQDFLTDKIPNACFWPKDWCLSFKWNECEKSEKFNEENKIIVFHGKPKPKDVLHLNWVKNNTFF